MVKPFCSNFRTTRAGVYETLCPQHMFALKITWKQDAKVGKVA